MARLRFVLACLFLTLAAAVCIRSPLLSQTQPAVQTPAPQVQATKKPAEVKTYTLSPEKYEKAVAYSRARYGLHFVEVIYGLLVLIVVLVRCVAPKFRAWAEAASRRRFVQALLFTPLLLLTVDVLSLPVNVAGHTLSVHYDQSVQGWGSWFWDWTKGELIEFVIMTVLIWILYGVIRRSPRRWWFYFWLASLPIIVFLLFIEPVVIQPLFFKFRPLEAAQPALVPEIEKVVARGGLSIPRQRMFEMKASEKLKSVNAYVSGIGASKRVVVWDTTLVKMTTPQTLCVFGHEMGHYVLGHIPKFITFISGMLLVFLFLGYHSMHWALGRWGERWRIRAVDDWASLPVLMLFISLFSFFGEPVVNTYSRRLEHQADIYGLEVVHGIVSDSPRAVAEAFQISGEMNLADPHPSRFIKVWLYSHPPLAERVVFAQQYDPWSKGQAPKFVR